MIEYDLGEGFTNSKPLKTSGGVQDIMILHEAAVTLLISRSRTPMGKAFNRHLHSVILPTIRKTGKFIAHPEFEDNTSDLKAKLEEVNRKILEVRLAIAETKLAKMESKKAKADFDSQTELFEAITNFCQEKNKVSVAELLYHIEPDKSKHNRRKQIAVINCLRRIGYSRDGHRHRIKLNGFNMQGHTWVKFN